MGVCDENAVSDLLVSFLRAYLRLRVELQAKKNSMWASPREVGEAEAVRPLLGILVEGMWHATSVDVCRPFTPANL